MDIKKMLAVGTAIIGTAVTAEGIVSSSVVGYQGQEANASGNTMMAPTFLSVNSATGCKLSDLTVTGYDAPEWIEEDEYYEGGCGAGDFVLQFLNANGSVAARYYWIDDGDVAPGWYANAGGKAITGGATSVPLSAGQGVWVLGRGMYLNFPAPEL